MILVVTGVGVPKRNSVPIVGIVLLVQMGCELLNVDGVVPLDWVK